MSVFRLSLASSLALGAFMVAGGPVAAAPVPTTVLDNLTRSGIVMPVEQAQYRGRRGGGPRYYRGGRGGRGGWYGGRGVGAGVAAGVLGGLIGGAIIGSSRPAYAAPVYEEPVYAAPAYGGGEVDYCMRRYRSYDPRTGTYVGYDGIERPCP